MHKSQVQVLVFGLGGPGLVSMSPALSSSSLSPLLSPASAAGSADLRAGSQGRRAQKTRVARPPVRGAGIFGC